MEKATISQLDFICHLCAQTGNDVEDYNLENMTKQQASELIDELKKEI